MSPTEQSNAQCKESPKPDDHPFLDLSLVDTSEVSSSHFHRFLVSSFVLQFIYATL